MPPINNDNSDLQPDSMPPVPDQPAINPPSPQPPISGPIQTPVAPPPVENLPPYPPVNQEPAISPPGNFVNTVPSNSSDRESLTNLTSFSSASTQPVAPAIQPISEKENIYTEICSQIIKEQEQIIGALAIEEADRVEGLTVDHNTYHCSVIGDGSKVIDDLIGQYRDFFGHAAVEVCKEAASRFITRLPAEALPVSLR